VRENAAALGDLVNDFDFTQAPRAPLILPATPVGSCVTSDASLCLDNNRFQVIATWVTPAGQAGGGHAVRLTDDTGYFWFFSNLNVEVVAKVIDGCAVSNTFWFFAGGLTNVQTTITVTDTVTGLSQTYSNPQSTAFQPIQDTSAFATCKAGAAAPAVAP
jgi:hypothetical protein